jgi:hypothetical protein
MGGMTMLPGESRLKQRDEWGFLWDHRCPLTGGGFSLNICRTCNGIASKGYAIQLYFIEEGEPYCPDIGNFDSWDLYGCKHHLRLAINPVLQLSDNIRPVDTRIGIEGPIWYSPFAAVLMPPPVVLNQMPNFDEEAYIQEQLVKQEAIANS